MLKQSFKESRYTLMKDRCKAKTKCGTRCKRLGKYDGVCYIHCKDKDEYTCCVCLELCADILECGHRIHPSCVKRAADELQDIRFELGYPALKTCTCPVCRAEVHTVVPKACASRCSLYLSPQQLLDIFIGWIDINISADGSSIDDIPLEWYIWTTLSEKYPDVSDQDELINVSGEYANTIRRITQGNMIFS